MQNMDVHYKLLNKPCRFSDKDLHASLLIPAIMRLLFRSSTTFQNETERKRETKIRLCLNCHCHASKFQNRGIIDSPLTLFFLSINMYHERDRKELNELRIFFFFFLFKTIIGYSHLREEVASSRPVSLLSTAPTSLSNYVFTVTECYYIYRILYYRNKFVMEETLLYSNQTNY